MNIRSELPDSPGRKPKETLLDCLRPKAVTRVHKKHLKASEISLERAAKKANTFGVLDQEMKNWEALGVAGMPAPRLEPRR